MEVNYPTIFGIGVGNGTLPEYARYFFNIGIGLAGILAVCVIAFGGVYFLIDFARGKFKDEGKEWIKAGIIGLLLVVCAYLIVFTINPYLTIFDLKGLPVLTYIANILNKPPESSAKIETYTPIQIGKSIESVVAFPMHCYKFDSFGDPITKEYQYYSPNYKLSGPTLLDHDGADCFLNLSEALKQKAGIMKKLADKISELMKQCKCNNSDNTLSPFTFYTVYIHMDKINVKIGQKVDKGDIIGEIGNTGSGSGTKPHLHFAVGPENPNPEGAVLAGGEEGGDEAISINIYSKIQAPNSPPIGWLAPIGQRAGGVAFPLPDWFTQEYQNYVLNSLSAPVSLGYCKWTEVLGSTLHNDYAYWAQDWVCRPDSGLSSIDINKTQKAKVMVMAGGTDIKSTVSKIYPSLGAVLIRHEVSPSTNPTATEQCKAGWATGKCDWSQIVVSEDECKKLGTKKCTGSANCECEKNKTCNVCPAGVKDKIEKGPIAVIAEDENQSCNQLSKDYKGLQEFRNLDKVKSAKEIEEKVECGDFYPPDQTGQRQDEATTAPIIIMTKNDLKFCQKYSKTKKVMWSDLTLVEQYVYLKEKMRQSLYGDNDTIGMQDRLNSLVGAESSLSKCYGAISYIDFIKKVNETDNKIIFIQPQKGFNRYCKDFAYANSQKYNFCSQECPITNFGCFTGCQDCSKKSGDKKQECFDNLNNCVAKCLKNQRCQNGSKFKNFEECFGNSQVVDSSLNTDAKNKTCEDLCSIKNPACSKAYKNCTDECKDDSSCLGTLSSADDHLAGILNCAINPNAILNIQECFKNYKIPKYQNACAEATLFTCKACSLQYAGYPDTVELKYSTDNYSSVDIFENKDIQKCPTCYTEEQNQTEASCVKNNPETAKGVSCSSCPNCPCLTCGVDCQKYGYNDDPLTFYCQDSWWLNDQTKKSLGSETSVGTERICPKNKEIPVGQAIDDAEAWAEKFIDKGKKIISDADDLLNYIKKIITDPQVKAGEYCKCDSKCSPTASKTLCQSKCKYEIIATTIENPSGGTSDALECHCVKLPCAGQPCQKMITLLTGEHDTDGNCADGVGFGYYYSKISGDVGEIKEVIPEKVDVVKELSYSRKETNDCSAVQNNYGDKDVLLSCTRVEHEIIDPVVGGQTTLGGKNVYSYCYGQDLGKISGKPDMADNWFCCDQRQKANPNKKDENNQ